MYQGWIRPTWLEQQWKPRSFPFVDTVDVVYDCIIHSPYILQMTIPIFPFLVTADDGFVTVWWNRRLELVANKKTNPHRNVWLHCTGWDWTCLFNHLSVHLPLSTNWVDAGARRTQLSVSSLKANSQWHSLSVCAGLVSVYFWKHNWEIVSFLPNLLIQKNVCPLFFYDGIFSWSWLCYASVAEKEGSKWETFSAPF